MSLSARPAGPVRRPESRRRVLPFLRAVRSQQRCAEGPQRVVPLGTGKRNLGQFLTRRRLRPAFQSAGFRLQSVRASSAREIKRWVPQGLDSFWNQIVQIFCLARALPLGNQPDAAICKLGIHHIRRNFTPNRRAAQNRVDVYRTTIHTCEAGRTDGWMDAGESCPRDGSSA